MSADTKIEWADHTFNPWIGCTKVGPGCDNCYAKADFEDRMESRGGLLKMIDRKDAALRVALDALETAALNDPDMEDRYYDYAIGAVKDALK